MEIRIQMANLTLTDHERTNLRSHIRQRIEHAFGRIRKRIRHVDVFINDVNGPRGGPDKRCVIKVDTQGNEPVVAHGLDRNLFGLVNLLTTTAVRGTLKRVRRARDDAMIQKFDDAAVRAHDRLSSHTPDTSYDAYDVHKARGTWRVPRTTNVATDEAHIRAAMLPSTMRRSSD